MLARYFGVEADANLATETQRQAARQLIESGQDLFLPKTVALELEWVLQGHYGFAVPQVLAVFEVLLGHPSLSVEDRPAVVQAVAAAAVAKRSPPSMITASPAGSVSSTCRHGSWFPADAPRRPLQPTPHPQPGTAQPRRCHRRIPRPLERPPGRFAITPPAPREPHPDDPGLVGD